ncbi:hypothetical protein GCK72_022431 [Caenorhabditis remanei]|uniref:Secreted protein n=1 Tax=Caenorhabditis remanei TaxID=31234 RepID=A0A6A5FUC0_CAERE|nr:hypothetical protein GCK72_022431 [Caenorhabditis remanei]KAF1745981.1 hypothetical protein GCK72_022431 [Caenorhabditis remanei]
MFGAPTYAHMVIQLNSTIQCVLQLLWLTIQFFAFPGQPPNQPVPFETPFFGHPGIQADMRKAEFFRPIMNEVFQILRSPAILGNGEKFRTRF